MEKLTALLPVLAVVVAFTGCVGDLGGYRNVEDYVAAVEKDADFQQIVSDVAIDGMGLTIYTGFEDIQPACLEYLIKHKEIFYGKAI